MSVIVDHMTDVVAVKRGDVRLKIVETATRLLREGGATAVTTRGVAEAAGVQAPTIYRLFGDKDGLLDAVAEHVLTTYVAAKAVVVAEAEAGDVDPLDDLRAGWDMQIDFALSNPSLFRLLTDPERMLMSPAAQSGKRVLEARIQRVAASGRLRVSERRAVDVVQAAGGGVVLLLLATPPQHRDPDLANAMYTAVLQQILTDPPRHAVGTVTATAVAFRAVVPELTTLTDAERDLMAEWLDRSISAG